MISKRVTLFSLLLTACSILRPTPKMIGLSALSFEIVPPTRELPVGEDSELWIAVKNNGTQAVAFVEDVKEFVEQLGDLPPAGVGTAKNLETAQLFDSRHVVFPGDTFFAGVNVRPQRAGPQNLHVNMTLEAISMETLEPTGEKRRLTATVEVIGCAVGTCVLHSAASGAPEFSSLPVSFTTLALARPPARVEERFGVWVAVRNESSRVIAFRPSLFGHCGLSTDRFGSCGGRAGRFKHLLLPGESYYTTIDVQSACAGNMVDVALNLESVSANTLECLNETVTLEKQLKVVVRPGIPIPFLEEAAESNSNICDSEFVGAVTYRSPLPPSCGALSTWLEYDINVAPTDKAKHFYWHYLSPRLPEVGGTYRFRCQIGTVRGLVDRANQEIQGVAIINGFSPVD